MISPLERPRASPLASCARPHASPKAVARSGRSVLPTSRLRQRDSRRSLIFTDGYHRICARYCLREDAEIPCRGGQLIEPSKCERSSLRRLRHSWTGRRPACPIRVRWQPRSPGHACRIGCESQVGAFGRGLGGRLRWTPAFGASQHIRGGGDQVRLWSRGRGRTRGVLVTLVFCSGSLLRARLAARDLGAHLIRSWNETEGRLMDCYVCAKGAQNVSAVVVCRGCGAGLCMDHLHEEARRVGGGLSVDCDHDTWSSSEVDAAPVRAES